MNGRVLTILQPVGFDYEGPLEWDPEIRAYVDEVFRTSDSCGGENSEEKGGPRDQVHVCPFQRGDQGGLSSTLAGSGGKSRVEHGPPRYDNCGNDLTTFKVHKRFSDGNSETPVILDFWCNNGTYHPESVEVYPDNSGDITEQTFIVENLPYDGPGSICTVTERPVDGYDTFYYCPPFESQSLTDESCNIPAEPTPGNDSIAGGVVDCSYSKVFGGQENVCVVNNRPTPVDVSVTKVWDVTNVGGDYFDTTANLWIDCDSGYEVYPNDNGEDILPADYTDGEYTLTVSWIPKWYPTAAKPADQEYTECWAEEDIAEDDSAVEQASTCGDDDVPGMQIAVGMGDSCVITNTVFFEGIPTLNQYGMAIMALLMLGMGFVGFRRFV